MRRDPRVVIFTDDPGWHGRELIRALATRGIDGVYASLKDCTFAVKSEAVDLFIPGFDGALPRGAFVRGVPGGSLEEVVLRLDFLHVLAALKTPVFNSGRAIERTVDKALTSVRLVLAGLPTPRTWVCEGAVTAAAIAGPMLAQGSALVVKPLFGSQGEGIMQVTSQAELATVVPAGGVFYLQEYLDRGGPPYRDWRVLVVAGRARFAMERVSAHWVTNRAQGATCIAARLTPEMAALAEAATAALEVDYAGIDLMRDARERWTIGEVNGVPAWWGLSQATGADVTAVLVDAFISKLNAAPDAGAD